MTSGESVGATSGVDEWFSEGPRHATSVADPPPLRVSQGKLPTAGHAT